MNHFMRSQRRRREQRTNRLKKTLAALTIASVAGFVLSGMLVAASLASLAQLKPPKIINQPQRSEVFSADGTLIGTFFIQNREPVPIEFMPRYFRDAVVAVEDKRFYMHKGIDFEGIVRAFFQNISKRTIAEGGSTITQQYVKNAIVGTEVSYTRKMKEAYLAMEMERRYTKSQILEAYINTVYYGHGAYGVQAAAETYFNKRVQDISLAEAALVAGLPKSPEGFSPYDNQAEAKRRQEDVLDKMVYQKYITKEQAVSAKNERLNYSPPDFDPDSKVAPYFVEHVKQLLLDKWGKQKVFAGGLKIHTTLDTKLQTIADNVVKNTLNWPGDPTASIVAVDPKTGHIKAMVGGQDFKTLKYNLATQGRRQPGSAFKAFVLVSALEKGMPPQKTFQGSSPINIRVPDSTEVWTVNNAEGSAYGAISVWDATVKSVNAVFAQMIMEVGPAAVVDTAKRMGITTPIEPYPAIAIGGLTTGVSPLEMASAFGTLATGGEYTPPIAITKVEDRDGKVILENKPKRKRAIDPKVSWQATQIMMDVVKRGTGTRADIGRPQAGKTGTAENYQDAWFAGYTPDLSAAVWMGHPQAQIQMRTVHDMPGYGGIIPATMWSEFMREALKDVPPHNFPTAPPIKVEPPKQTTTTKPPSSSSTTAPTTTAPTTTQPTTTAPPPPTTTAPPPPPTTAPPPPTTAPPPPTTTAPPPPTTAQPP